MVDWEKAEQLQEFTAHEAAELYAYMHIRDDYAAARMHHVAVKNKAGRIFVFEIKFDMQITLTGAS
jgi:hypothetical protein